MNDQIVVSVSRSVVIGVFSYLSPLSGLYMHSARGRVRTVCFTLEASSAK